MRSNELSNVLLALLGFVYISATHCDMCDIFSAVLWARKVRETCWLAFCIIQLDVVGHSGRLDPDQRLPTPLSGLDSPSLTVCFKNCGSPRWKVTLSAHDNVMWFKAKNVWLSLSMMHCGSESQSQHNVTTSMWLLNSLWRHFWLSVASLSQTSLHTRSTVGEMPPDNVVTVLAE